MQLALPAPHTSAGTSLLASLLKINICQHQNSVKHILIFSENNEKYFVLLLLINYLHFLEFFKILKNIWFQGSNTPGIRFQIEGSDDV